MGDKPDKLGDITVVDCTVLHTEAAGSLIVATKDGQTTEIETPLPDVHKGHGGKIFTLNGKRIFIREPYGFDD